MSVEVRTEPLGGGELARLALSGSAPAAWYPPPPRGAAEWRRRAGDVHGSLRTPGWLRALAPAIEARGAAAERLERCARGGGVLVTTGQQPGLFGGPIYTWSKAVSALALADAIEGATGVPTAPLFWAATDDADFAEASWTMVAVQGGVETLQMVRASGGELPMARTPLGDVSHLVEQLELGAGSAAYAGALDAVRAAYAPGQTVGGAYLALLRDLLEPLGIAVLDASHPATAAAALPHLRLALTRAAAVEHALQERDREIAARGFEPQVAAVEGLSLVFANGAHGKRRIPTAEAVAAGGGGPPGTLSPNVLLRPVIERAILPTVAYVAGPGELAYFAQVSAVADALEIARPLAVPRWSGTIIEPHVARILARHALTPDDFRQPDAVETRLARAAVPPAVAATVDELRATVTALTLRLESGDGAAQAVVPRPVVEGARRQLLHRIDRLERRYVAATKRREVEMMADLATARGALYPAGKRQERALNLIPLLARHGPPLLDTMRAHAASGMVAVAGLEPAVPATPLATTR
jgi:uncharacterized protein YllA (UPF0747 family)